MDADQVQHELDMHERHGNHVSSSLVADLEARIATLEESMRELSYEIDTLQRRP